MGYGTVPASMAGLRLSQRPCVAPLAQAGFGQRVYITFSKCEKVLMGKLSFCSLSHFFCFMRSTKTLTSDLIILSI